MRCFFLFAIAIAVAACGHVPVTSLPKLNRLDIMTLDLEQLRVAVVMPERLHVRDGGTVIVLGVKESVAGPALEERVVLANSMAAESGSGLPEGVQIFRIPPHDIARFDALRETIRQRKQAYPDDTKGFLAVTSNACRTAQLPDGPLPVDTWLRTSPGAPYFILTRRVDMRSLIPETDLNRTLPPCADRTDG